MASKCPSACMACHSSPAVGRRGRARDRFAQECDHKNYLEMQDAADRRTEKARRADTAFKLPSRFWQNSVFRFCWCMRVCLCVCVCAGVGVCVCVLVLLAMSEKPVVAATITSIAAGTLAKHAVATRLQSSEE